MNTHYDEQELWLKFAETRDPELRETLVLRYVPLVHYVMGRLGLSERATVEYEDALSNGLLGLIDAIDHFDPARGLKFSTYGTFRVRGHIMDYLRSIDWLSRNARQRVKALQQATDELWQTFQRAPTEEELARRLGVEQGELDQTLIDVSFSFVSLDRESNSNEEEGVSLHDLLVDEDTPDPAEAFGEMERNAGVVTALKNLPQRQQLVLALYYENELTLREIGEVLGVSESRVCQLHAQALASLRAQLVDTSPADPGAAAPPARRQHGFLQAYAQNSGL